MSFINTITQIIIHPIFLATAASFIISQLVKFIINISTHKSYAVEALYQGYAGMPSTHTAIVSAVTFSIFFTEGVSTLFMLSFFWAAITIADLLSVTWFHTPRNKIITELLKVLRTKHHKKLLTPPMNVGHSIPDILVGILISFIVSYLIYFVI